MPAHPLAGGGISGFLKDGPVESPTPTRLADGRAQSRRYRLTVSSHIVRSSARSSAATVRMIVRLASEQDAVGFIVLAGEVEHWFGAMVDPGFRTVIDRHIRRATALAAVIPGETDLLGGLLFSVGSA